MSEDGEHLREIPTGAGCTEIWEKLSEQREEGRNVDRDSDPDPASDPDSDPDHGTRSDLGADAAVDLTDAECSRSDDDR
ncbi:hypothetical protein ACFQAS_05335 [Halopenitus salinus]|jgi:hypothetical protein|uniref:Uncharacterized protein n=1 Tax=Halopenitus salinus TaxID=1198295 RepID=A0ABD5UWB1_9EURY